MDIQELLDKEARLFNEGRPANERYAILKQIKLLRGDEPPHCWGQDDCSMLMLIRCPWRIDCEEKNV